MNAPVFVAGTGIISAIGNNVAQCLDALENSRAGMDKMHHLDSLHRQRLPVAEVKHSNEELAKLAGLPNTKSRTALLSDAVVISQTKDLKLQREKFATLSTNLFALAKTVKLTTEPVYQQYCPMKKASWLSNNRAIKNPYYGSAMLTCGSVKTTL